MPNTITPDSMQRAIDFAKQDPSSSYAQELQQRIQSGAYNSVLQQMGKDTSKYGQQPAAPASDPTSPSPAPTPSPIAETGSNYMGQVAPAASDVNDFIKGISGGSVDDGGPQGNLGKAVDEFGKGNIASGAEDATLGVASDAVKSIFAPITAPLQTLFTHAAAGEKQAIATGNDPVGKAAVDLFSSPEAQAAKAQISTWAQAHPDIAKSLGDAFNVGTGVVGSEGLNADVGDTLASVKNGVSNAAQTAKQTVSDAVLGTPESQAAKAAASQAKTAAADTETIQSTISPKLGVKEVRQALDDGRIVSGSDPTLLRDGTPDTVLPSDKTVAATETIRQQIPGAAKMKAPELYTALDTHIANTSKALRPQMEAVPVTDEAVTKAASAWDASKPAQLENPYMPAAANIEKLQGDFEKNYLSKVKSGSTMADQWDNAIAYDKSVPSNVKQATSLSTDALQAQKAFWLQNRAILRGVINDTSTGLGKTSQDAFAQMHNMYDAKTGIRSGFKLDKTGAPSKLKTFGQTTPGKIVKHVVKTAVGAAAGNVLGGTPGEAAGAIIGSIL